MAVSIPGTSTHKTGIAIKNQVNAKSSFKIELIDTTSGSYDNLKLLASGECDFAIIQNSLDYDRTAYLSAFLDKNIRTVFPLYYQVLLIIYHDSLLADDIFSLLKGRRIEMGQKNGGTA